MAIRLEGLNAVKSNLKKEIDKLTYQITNNMKDEGLKILEEAKNRCPVATGNLMNSGFIVWKTPRTVRSYYTGRFVNPPNKKNSSVSTSLTASRTERILGALALLKSTKSYGVIIGFSAPYALKIHETPLPIRYRISGKTKGKSPSGRKYPFGTWADNGEWKWLETALKKSVGGLLYRISKVRTSSGGDE